MRVLVTGGTGYLGRAIVRAVADRGHEPVVFARHATRARLPGRAIDGDVRDRAAFEAAAHGVDALCHSAALVSVWRRDAREFDQINIGGLENAIAISARAQTLAADLHLVVPRVAAAGSHDTARSQRLPAHKGRGPSRRHAGA